MTFAPRSLSARSVGAAATMRVSSETRPPSSGTLRSSRTRTRLPLTSASARKRAAMRYADFFKTKSVRSAMRDE
jgi:hypothetical protein